MIKKSITKKEIINSLYRSVGFSKLISKKLIDDVLKILYSGMKNTKHVKITEFGTFKSLNKRERTGRNPKTKVLSKISPRKVITFKGSKLLIKKLNTKKNDKET